MSNPATIIRKPRNSIKFPKPYRPKHRATDLDIPSSSLHKTGFDFRFVLHPSEVKLVRQAVASLSDLELNPSTSGLMGFDESGVDIAVQYTTHFEDELEYYLGYICLYAEKLDQFVCNKPMRRRVSLRQIHLYLKNAQDDATIAIYVESGTDLLFFHYTNGNNLGLGPYMKSTKLYWDVEYESRIFPPVLYGMEIVIPSSVLVEMCNTMLDKDSDDRPDYITMKITPTTVRTQVGEKVLESTTEHVNAWLTWTFWDAMKTATSMANECAMYLALSPYHHIMLKFNVGELGYLVYLKKEPHSFDKWLPGLGFFEPII